MSILNFTIDTAFLLINVNNAVYQVVLLRLLKFECMYGLCIDLRTSRNREVMGHMVSEPLNHNTVNTIIPLQRVHMRHTTLTV
jgi:hypothetical protein